MPKFGTIEIDGEIIDLDAVDDQKGSNSSSSSLNAWSDITPPESDDFFFFDTASDTEYFTHASNPNLTLHRKLQMAGNPNVEIPAVGDGNCFFNGYTLGLIDIIKRHGTLPIDQDKFAQFWSLITSTGNINIIQQRANNYAGSLYNELCTPISNFIKFIQANPNCSLNEFCTYIKQQNTRIDLAGLHLCLAPALRELANVANTTGQIACSLEDGVADAGDVEFEILSEFFNLTPRIVTEQPRKYWVFSINGKQIAETPDLGDEDDFLKGFTSGLMHVIQQDGKLLIDENDFSLFWGYVKHRVNVEALRQKVLVYSNTHQKELVAPLLKFIEFIKTHPNCSSQNFYDYVNQQKTDIEKLGFSECLIPAMREFFQNNIEHIPQDAGWDMNDPMFYMLCDLFGIQAEVTTKNRSELFAFDPSVKNITSKPEDYTISLLHVPGHWNFLIPADPVRYAHWYDILPIHFQHVVHKVAEVVEELGKAFTSPKSAEPDIKAQRHIPVVSTPKEKTEPKDIDIEAEVNFSVGKILDALEEANISDERRQRIFEDVFNKGQEAYRALAAEPDRQKRFDLFKDYKALSVEVLRDVRNIKSSSQTKTAKTCRENLVEDEQHVTQTPPISVK